MKRKVNTNKKLIMATNGSFNKIWLSKMYKSKINYVWQSSVKTKQRLNYFSKTFASRLHFNWNSKVLVKCCFFFIPINIIPNEYYWKFELILAEQSIYIAREVNIIYQLKEPN